MTPPRIDTRSRLWAFLVLLPLASLMYLMGRAEPGSYGWIPGCPSHSLTGLYCPGCGSLRALHCLLTGDIGEAFRSNALLAPALLLVLVSLFQDLVTPGRGPLSTGSRVSRVAGTGFLIAVVLYTVFRNLPFSFALWLRPA